MEDATGEHELNLAQICIAFVMLHTRAFFFFLWWQESLLPGFAMQTLFYKNVVFGMASKHLHSPSMELLLGSSHLVAQNGQGVKRYYIDLHDNLNPLNY